MPEQDAVFYFSVDWSNFEYFINIHNACEPVENEDGKLSNSHLNKPPTLELKYVSRTSSHRADYFRDKITMLATIFRDAYFSDNYM